MAYKKWFSSTASSFYGNIQSVPSRIQSYYRHLHVTRLVKTGRVLERVGSYDGIPKMLEKAAIKDLLYGGVMEILNNPEFYYNSKISSDYNRFTDRGKVAMEGYLKTVAALMLTAEEESLNKRAKEMVINSLKGDKV